MYLCLPLASSVPIKAFLSHEDLLPNDYNGSSHAWNPYMLKEQVFAVEEKWPEWTLCIRLKFLSFKQRKDWSTIMSWATGIDGNVGGGIRMRDSSEGHLIWFQTFVNMTEIMEQGGIWASWPKWKEPINAGEWNHICWRISVSESNFVLVHNGYTQLDFKQVFLYIYNI